jgi:hypothetical protein
VVAAPKTVRIQAERKIDAPVIEFSVLGVLTRCSEPLELGRLLKLSITDPDGYDYWAEARVTVVAGGLLGFELLPDQPAPLRQAFRRWAGTPSPSTQRLEARLLSVPPPDPEVLRQLVSDLE